jgi:hypothetical protein
MAASSPDKPGRELSAQIVLHLDSRRVDGATRDGAGNVNAEAVPHAPAVALRKPGVIVRDDSSATDREGKIRATSRETRHGTIENEHCWGRRRWCRVSWFWVWLWRRRRRHRRCWGRCRCGRLWLDDRWLLRECQLHSVDLHRTCPASWNVVFRNTHRDVGLTLTCRRVHSHPRRIRRCRPGTFGGSQNPRADLSA